MPRRGPVRVYCKLAKVLFVVGNCESSVELVLLVRLRDSSA